MPFLTAEVLTELLKAAVKYGPDIALEFAKLFKNGATINDAIAALEKAKTKTAQQYLDEAKAASNPT